AEDGRAGADERGSPGGKLRDPEVLHDQRAGDGTEPSADRSLPGLAGGDPFVKLVLSEGTSGEVRAGVVEPGDRQSEDDPPLAGLQLPDADQRRKHQAGI